MTVTEDSICEGESTSLAAIAAGGNGGPYSYTWNAIGTNVNGFNSSPDSTFLLNLQYHLLVHSCFPYISPTSFPLT